MSHSCDAIFSFEGQSDVSDSIKNCHLKKKKIICVFLMLWTCHELLWCLIFAHIKLAQYLQNSSKPQFSQNCGISNGLRPNTGQTNPVDLRDMLTSACPRSLSHFPSFYFLPCSDQRDHNPPQQLSVQTDSVKRFPSIFLSLTHTHTQITSLLFCTQMHFSPHTPLSNESGSLCLSGGVSALNWHASPADHKKILRSAVLALTYRFTWKW